MKVLRASRCRRRSQDPDTQKDSPEGSDASVDQKDRNCGNRSVHRYKSPVSNEDRPARVVHDHFCRSDQKQLGRQSGFVVDVVDCVDVDGHGSAALVPLQGFRRGID